MTLAFVGAAKPLTEAEYVGVTRALAREIWAVIRVETSGVGFDRHRAPRILFERHIFDNQTHGRFSTPDNLDISNPSPGGYTTDEYSRLRRAMALDESAALKSCSWGLGQIMGFNYRRAGYESVYAMVEAFTQSEHAQLVAMMAFIESIGLRDELLSHDWLSFARIYNGPAQQGYDKRLAHEYDRTSRRMPDFALRATQMRLYFEGILPASGVDGINGPDTQYAIAKSAAAHGKV